jgi:hypothetical protein
MGVLVEQHFVKVPDGIRKDSSVFRVVPHAQVMSSEHIVPQILTVTRAATSPFGAATKGSAEAMGTA